MTQTIGLAILEIFGLLALGVFARRLAYFQDEDLTRWSRFAIDFLLPGLAFHAITEHLDPGRLRLIWIAPLIAVGIMLVGTAVGFLCQPRGAGVSPALQRTFRHFCAMNNYSYLPIPIIQKLWGDAVLADFFIFNLGSTIAYWTLGVALLGGHSPRTALRQVFSPNVIAIFLGTALCLAGWQPYIPATVTDIAGALGVGAIPMLVMLVGGGLYPFPSFRHKRLLIVLAALRLLVIPAINLALLQLIPMPDEIRRIAQVVALMPAAVTSVILARRYGADSDFAAEVAVATTMLSALTIPIILGFLLR